MKVTGNSVDVEVRTYFSIQHIQSAALFCRESLKLENECDGKFNHELHTKNLAYVTGAVFSSVCFLEATINEFFCDTKDNKSRVNYISDDKISLLSKLWDLKIPRTASYSITDKYQIALTLLDLPVFNNGIAPFQDVDLLIQLRNSLIHFEPEWNSCTSNDFGRIEKKFSERLRGKFETSKLFINSGNPFFPNKCLGYGCAKWAVKNSVDFVDGFCSKIGRVSTIDHVRANLNTE